MAYTERDRAALEDGLRRLSEHNDELLLRGLDRLGRMGSTLQPRPPDKFWPTTLALTTWHQQQRRAIGATLGALSRLTRRVGANGVNRYPTSEWGEPLAFVTWMRRAGSRPLTLGDATPQGETCPSCGMRPLIVTQRAKGFGSRHEQRTFGHCHECKFTVDLTGCQDVESTAPPKHTQPPQPPPPLSSSKPRDEGNPGGTPDGTPYFDDQVNGWRRNIGSRIPLLVAGQDDHTEPHSAKHRDADCWACGMAPHSRAYHDLQIAESLAEHGIKRIEENGRLRIEPTDPSERFQDESAQ